MLLAQIQHDLAALYEAPLPYDIYDFVITDARLAEALTPATDSANNLERLLIQPTLEDPRLSLYIDSEVLARLQADNPTISLHTGNLAEYLIALEGVSHLHYVIWNVERENTVSLLELEIQAEVDKYVACAKLFSEQNAGSIPSGLHQTLFDTVGYDMTLGEEAQSRYQEANYFAAKYCSALRRRFPGHHGHPSFLRELRAFYRLTQNEKIQRIRCIN
ncbi:MAG: hypothetical protein EXR86_02095 [Gammaproteobacteria bacterium]|nr:hypothetical protein [Gammaproteobacteria bacterium]